MDKNKKTFQVPTLLAFAAIVAIMVIVGVRVLNVPVVLVHFLPQPLFLFSLSACYH